MQARAERVDLDPAQLRQLEDRLNLVQSLKRKYGGSVESVHGLRREGRGATGRAGRPRRIPGHAGPAGKGGARRAGKGRGRTYPRRGKKIAGPLGEKISQELRALGFNKALFQVEITPAPKPGASGGDHVEFIFAPNPGEAARPLRAIASSGEMARVMLAVKTTLAEVDEIPILIFDEVDANVGGETAGQVGQEIARAGPFAPGALHHPSAAGRGAGAEPFRGGEAGEAKPHADRIDPAGRRRRGSANWPGCSAARPKRRWRWRRVCWRSAKGA